MTAVVILLLGGSAVLILSAQESIRQAQDVSVVQTIIDIWNDNVTTAGNSPPTSGTPTSGTQPLSNNTNAGPTSQIQSSTL